MSDQDQEPIFDGNVHDVLKRLFRSGRTNAIVAWLLISVLLLVLVESLLDFDLGLADTIADLTFNSIGALIVAVFGHVHLSNVAETIRTQLSLSK